MVIFTLNRKRLRGIVITDVKFVRKFAEHKSYTCDTSMCPYSIMVDKITEMIEKTRFIFPHIICFVWFQKKKAFSFSSSNRQVFSIETHSVLCEVLHVCIQTIRTSLHTNVPLVSIIPTKLHSEYRQTDFNTNTSHKFPITFL